MTVITDERLALTAAAYLDAALNKIEVAAFHQEHLGERLRSGEAARVEIQAYFEGELYAGIAATDQIAEVLNRGFALRLRNANLRRALEALEDGQLEPETEQVLEDLRQWRDRSAVEEAGNIRRRATHHYYAKGVHRGEWQYEAGEGLAVEDGGGVGLLGEAFAADLADLRQIIERLAQALGVDGRLAGLRDARP